MQAIGLYREGFMKIRLALMAATVLGLAACSETPPPATPSGPAPEPESAQPSAEPVPAESDLLALLVEEYFEIQLQRAPVLATSIGDDRYNDLWPNDLTDEWRAETRAIEERFLASVEQIDREQLTGQDLLTWEVFRRARAMVIEGLQFPDHLLPVSQFFSPPNFFAQMGSGVSIQPFEDAKDYENFLARVDGFVAWMDQAIANMRQGVEQGIVQPRVLIEKAIPQLAAHLVDDVEKSIFFGPLRNFPEDLPATDRQRLEAAFRTAIREKIVPAYRRMRDFLRDEYLEKTRDSVGLYALPNGAAWYAYLARLQTTTDVAPAEIHEIGLREVARIQGEIREVMKQVGFAGNLKAFFKFMNEDPQFLFSDKEQLLQGYRDRKAVVSEASKKLFSLLPKADFEVRPIEEFREQSAAGAQYQRPSADGSRAGVFYVNTYDLKSRPSWAMDSLFAHEAIPGHHFQIALQQEIEDLPRFRRFGGQGAYIEGWALYAESLGKEVGLYADPYQYFGGLNAELFRAVRLVVDTGLHLKGWTRQQVLDYMADNLAVHEVKRISEAERYMAIPGQALSYKMGQLKIAELRRRAEEKLGERFDIKVFHAQVLGDGSLPLSVLESKIDRWLADAA
ncbi:MAG: DUF885 domain-containing protein [Gammaproteobacteria bacterium]|nr:DUF885 domain-containing protein [Gammaproteobacteria bacterium]